VIYIIVNEGVFLYISNNKIKVMEARKNKKYDLSSYRTLFFNIGLVIALLFVIAAFEWRFYDDQDLLNVGPADIEFVETVDVPLTEQPPPPPPQNQLRDVKIIAVDDVEEIEEEIQINLDIEMTEETVIEEVIEVTVEEVEEEEAEEIFVIVEDAPAPVGGFSAFYDYVNANIKYPRQAINMRIEGKVFVQFVVDKTGKLTDITIIRGIGGGCDEEAIRIIENAPMWNAGKQRGKPVKVRMVLPITFTIAQ
jgi:protein TonB